MAAIMDILSIQSAVLHGCVGNNAAIPVLQSLGWQPLALHTVWYTHHKGHPGWQGESTPLPLFEQFLSYAFQAPHLQVTTVLSGYLGSLAQATALARSLPAGVQYICDPVMGDFPGGQYVSDDLVQVYRDLLVPRATVVLPNLFELGVLTGTSVTTLDAAALAAQVLLERYVSLQLVLVTGIPHQDMLHLLAVSRTALARTHHPLISSRIHGTGDAFSAAWLALYLHSGDVPTSLTYAAQFVLRAVQRSAREQQRELQVIPELPWLQQAARHLTPGRILTDAGQ